MENELYHYGRKGMKWYQNIFTKGKQAAAARKKRKAEKEKLSEEKKKAEAEEFKSKVRNSRSPEMIYKNAHLFTDKEIEDINKRLHIEKAIKELIPSKVNKGKKFVEGISNNASTISTLATNINNAYTNVGKLFSKLNKDKKAPGADKASEKKPESTVEDIPGFKKPNTSNSASKSKPIVDAVKWETYTDPDMTSLARSMTHNVGSRTVSWAMNNSSRIESGANFTSNLLALPAPKDD